MSAQIFFLHAVEPLHPGIGQGAGTIDLPISREKPTNWPRQVGSGIKGPLRDASSADEAIKNAVFGKDGDGGTGAAQFGDARILLFPLASWRGTFAYVTSPLALRFFVEDLSRCGNTAPADIPTPAAGTCRLPQFSALPASDFAVESKWNQQLTIISTKPDNTKSYSVALDEFDIPTLVSPLVAQWAVWLGRQLFSDSVTGQQRIAERLCVVNDDIFSALVQSGTEVIARIRLDDQTKSVVDGALWYEELLPRETVLTGVMTATPLPAHDLTKAQVLRHAVSTPLVQIGGKASVGRGHCRLLVPQAPQPEAN